MIRAAAGTVLGGVFFLAALELAHPTDRAVRAWLRRRDSATALRPCPDWTGGRCGF